MGKVLQFRRPWVPCDIRPSVRRILESARESVQEQICDVLRKTKLKPSKENMVFMFCLIQDLIEKKGLAADERYRHLREYVKRGDQARHKKYSNFRVAMQKNMRIELPDL